MVRLVHNQQQSEDTYYHYKHALFMLVCYAVSCEARLYDGNREDCHCQAKLGLFVMNIEKAVDDDKENNKEEGDFETH